MRILQDSIAEGEASVFPKRGVDQGSEALSFHFFGRHRLHCVKEA